MSRHIADHRRSPEGGRLKNFIGVERTQGTEGTNPAAKALHTRAVTRDDTVRLRQYYRIERGLTA
ncbi:MAG: hypothetical protein KDE03_09815 [Rhodobacteraceae bacterium]|nr:hypothetical protein [Paracoccaceae bacterium]